MPMYKNGYEISIGEIAKTLAGKERKCGTFKDLMGISSQAVHNAAMEIMREYDLLPKEKKTGPSKYLLGKNGRQWTVEERKYRCRTWRTVATFDYETEAREHLAKLKG